jgi:hypothetical protein
MFRVIDSQQEVQNHSIATALWLAVASAKSLGSAR